MLVETKFMLSTLAKIGFQVNFSFTWNAMDLGLSVNPAWTIACFLANHNFENFQVAPRSGLDVNRPLHLTVGECTKKVR